MPSRAMGRSVAGPGLLVLVLVLAACSHAPAATGTTRDRAACAQLGNAYASFNAEHGSRRPIATYQKAIAVAQLADNAQLRVAIVDWVGAMSSLSSGKAASGAPYATQECRRIGLPLSFGSPAPGPAASSPSPPTHAGSPTTEADNESGNGGD
jgi:hypothetical protein